MQRPYYDAAINKLTTGTAPVERSACPAPDIPHEAALFQPGDRVTFTAYYRDQLDSLSQHHSQLQLMTLHRGTMRRRR